MSALNGTQSLSYYSDSDGTLGPNDTSSLLRPLTLKISEAVDSIKVSHGDSVDVQNG